MVEVVKFLFIVSLCRFGHAEFDDLAYAFFYGRTVNEAKIISLKLIDDIASQKAFDTQRPTVLYIHGFRESLSSESVQTVVKAFLKRNSHNVLVLDWALYANGSYVHDAVPHLVKIGKLMGQSVYSLLKRQAIRIDDFHVVGHSLGAQMSGYIGRWLLAFSRNSFQLNRITGLDPAKPLFYSHLVSLPSSLSYIDAKMVDVIHTDAGVLGADVQTGSVDFWPNGGVGQPGCKDEPKCDHSRSWRYFAESVASLEPKFFAVKCATFDDFKNFNCSENLMLNNMGIDVLPNTFGNYYLQTNSFSNFDRGILGARYSNDNLDRNNLE